MKRAGIARAVYVGIVVLFETFLGVVQPSGGASGLPMLVLTTTDVSGVHDRRLASFHSDDRLSPPTTGRAPGIGAHSRIPPYTSPSTTAPGAPTPPAEYAQVLSKHPIPLPVRFLMGFPPRELLRLDPRP